ncbi:MAG TPA: nucleotidyltransferase family protein [Verrucomicrobiae bacterium]|jgi:MurNAc alpha-1-phosphate uridylyltransferase
MRPRIKKAMLLAAGFGVRLKPLTDRTPKPLVPVAGRPMIEYALDKLRDYGVEEIVINVSHLKTQLVDYFAAQKNFHVTISEEAEPLETGGGLKKAEPFLGDEPIFAINSDILWTDESETALNRLTQNWDDAKMDFLLLAQSKSRAVGHDKGEDHLFIKPENTLGWNAADAPYIISGIGIFHPRVLRDAPEGKFSVKVLWLKALAQNRLFCLPHHGRWFQTGTLADIRKTEEVIKGLGL